MMTNIFRAARGVSALCAAALAFMLILAPAASARDFSDAQTRSIEKIIRDYLIEHPEVLVEAMQVLQEREEAAEKEGQDKALVAHKDILEKDPDSFVAGNPKGDITIVEFFDYRCGYCRHALKPLLTAVKKDGNVRLVFKELPILGDDSLKASRAAIASLPQGRYLEFHQALYESKGKLTDEKVMSIAKDVGLDTARLARDMKNPKIERVIERNMALAQALAIRGTPAFVIKGKVYPGAMSGPQIETAIREARDRKS